MDFFKSLSQLQKNRQLYCLSWTTGLPNLKEWANFTENKKFFSILYAPSKCWKLKRLSRRGWNSLLFGQTLIWKFERIKRRKPWVFKNWLNKKSQYSDWQDSGDSRSWDWKIKDKLSSIPSKFRKRVEVLGKIWANCELSQA